MRAPLFMIKAIGVDVSFSFFCTCCMIKICKSQLEHTSQMISHKLLASFGSLKLGSQFSSTLSIRKFEYLYDCIYLYLIGVTSSQTQSRFIIANLRKPYLKKHFYMIYVRYKKHHFTYHCIWYISNRDVFSCNKAQRLN